MSMPERPPAPPAPPSGYLPVARDMVAPTAMFWWTVGTFFAGVLGANMVGIFFVAANSDLTDPIPFTVVFLGQSGGSFLLIWLFSQRAASGSLQADVGFAVKLSDWWGLFAGMGLQVAVAFAMYPLIQLLFPDGAPEQGVAGIAEGTETSLEIILIFVSVAVLAPIVEEIVYRGMVLAWLHRFMGKWPAIVLSAAVFAGIHLIDWNARAAIPGLFVIGVVLGWAALRRGDLSLAIPLHAGVNLLAAFLLVWGTEIVDWAENQVGELEPIDGIINVLATLAGF